ncbi:hypothetical protein ACLPJF_08330 [Pseudomonas vlassakiae]|uniref:hypothetical protein n=1 Tax=Pseudomonas TaxID=286 RepID=UPI0021144D55|nr:MULTISPECIES: hypothetical protein [unclassified Pseudomonas]
MINFWNIHRQPPSQRLSLRRSYNPAGQPAHLTKMPGANRLQIAYGIHEFAQFKPPAERLFTLMHPQEAIAMSSESSVHSNALNFMSFMQNGVDSRTGQYTVTIKLPDLAANLWLGPDIELSLSFNPLNTIDSGWGKGWNLSLTQYTEHNQILTTYTGEAFKVTGSTGDRYSFQEQKLSHFHLYREPPGEGGAPRYRVVHRSGMVEILQTMGSARGTIALPVEIYSPQGHKLNLSYKQFNAEYMMLGAIRDGRGELLLEVEREDGFIEIRERPYLGGDGKPVALYVMTLQDVDNRVASFSLPTAEQASWRFDYKVVLEHLCITEVRTPTGAREYLQYNDGGHLFPSGERKPLPRVTRHIVEPGLQQPAFQTNYSYPQNSNFWGLALVSVGRTTVWTISTSTPGTTSTRLSRNCATATTHACSASPARSTGSTCRHWYEPSAAPASMR